MIANVRKPIHEVFGEDLKGYKNVFFIEPLQYLEFVYLMEKSTVVLTDSGGIQEEAPGLGKPVLVMRDTTERPEALKSGTVHLVGTNHDLIVSEVSTLQDDAAAYERMSTAVNPYGDGKACWRIVRVFLVSLLRVTLFSAWVTIYGSLGPFYRLYQTTSFFRVLLLDEKAVLIDLTRRTFDDLYALSLVEKYAEF